MKALQSLLLWKLSFFEVTIWNNFIELNEQAITVWLEEEEEDLLVFYIVHQCLIDYGES